MSNRAYVSLLTLVGGLEMMGTTKQLFAARINQSAVAGVDLCTIYFNVADQQDKLKFFSYSLTFPLSSTTEGESEEEAREDSYKSRIARSVIQES
ncbi:hypothetical protein KSP40_PGU022065 [Platanthera guangdongensis]|uniref:Uncharacterized protein n=1 Tax=Platanthera guangdongensis TaxID=2320717 RepID=A0ABR2MSH8_9ASPA